MEYDPGLIERESARTNPDFRLYLPKNIGYEDDNVHIGIFYHERFGGLIAFWTQSSFDAFGDNHIVVAYSKDDGKTWTEPRYIMGTLPGHGTADLQCSWGTPVVSKSGRIYLFYFRETEYVDYGRCLTAAFACIYSDDCGFTWSESTDIPMRMTPFDACGIQNNNIYQMARRGSDGVYMAGYTKWTSTKVLPRQTNWMEDDAHLYFMRFENIDDDPEPKDIKITFLPDDDRGVGIPYFDGRSCAQEPCPVTLPDGSIFCSMRTALGFAAYTVSRDGGHTWTEAAPITDSEGKKIVHPLSPCPVFTLSDGSYVLLYHGHAENIGSNRNLVYRIRGTFAPEEKQPIRFDASTAELFMGLPEDSDFKGHNRPQLAIYGTTVDICGRTVLWYPDRKCFLLGKYLD